LLIAAATPWMVTEIASSSADPVMMTLVPTEVMSSGCLVPGLLKVDTVPDVVIRPIDPCPDSGRLVNHRAPSGPAVINRGSSIPVPVKLVTTPAVVIRPIELFAAFVNQRAPSGPAVIDCELSMPLLV
jgi:hypothetical protein